MAIGAIGARIGADLGGPGKLAAAVPQAKEEFAAVLGKLQQQGADAQALVRQAAAPSPAEGRAAEGLYRQKLAEVQQPGGAERMLGELERGQARLASLLSEVQGGKSYSARELLGVQAEIHQISRELEVASKVVAEVAGGVKTLLQQQV
ncbi:MAG TPA: hypothetical protein VLX28_02965 [Thermoanaerobaculia bacterium]|nr:hypothetical protein [Thermoanaerobaculia bacterium]